STATANITQKSISDSTVSLTISPGTSFDYTGDEIEVTYAVRDSAIGTNGTALSLGSDYVLAKGSNTKATASGSYTIKVTGTGNYTGTLSQDWAIGMLDLSKCTLTITPSSYFYNGAALTVNISVKDGNTELFEDSDYTIDSSSTVSATDEGTYTISITGINNYFGTLTGTWKIEDPETRKIKSTDKTVTYDGNTVDISDMFTVGSDLLGTTYSVTNGTGSGTIKDSTLTVKKAGTIKVTATAVTTDTVKKTATATLTVNKGKGAATITVADVMYGKTPSPTVASTTNKSAKNTVTYLLSGQTTPADTVSGVGSYTATVTYEATDLYESCSASATFNVTKANLRIKAEEKTKTYGAADPALTYTATGFVGSDTKTSALTGSLSRAAGENAGTYNITIGSLSAANYSIAYDSANLIIKAGKHDNITVPITVTVPTTAKSGLTFNFGEYVDKTAQSITTYSFESSQKTVISGTPTIKDKVITYNVKNSADGTKDTVKIKVSDPNFADYNLIINIVSSIALAEPSEPEPTTVDSESEPEPAPEPEPVVEEPVEEAVEEETVDNDTPVWVQKGTYDTPTTAAKPESIVPTEAVIAISGIWMVLCAFGIISIATKGSALAAIKNFFLGFRKK
ncbi:MAG: hypothetical protein J6N76_00890, partial [Lachnospiraceae bacterium]|nr:hypothetical protein [Lachnospiraceae bacterium]